MPTTKKTRTSTQRRSGTDAITLLKKDHEKVRGLLKRLHAAADKNDGRAEELVEQIDQEIKIHSQIEEEIFYPAFRDAARNKQDRELFFEAKEEHHVVDMILPEVREGEGSEEFPAKAKVLKDLIEHHAEEEETEMFPKARKLFNREELVDLGRRLKERKEELMGK